MIKNEDTQTVHIKKVYPFEYTPSEELIYFRRVVI